MFKVDDKIAFSADFCRSIRANAGDIPHMRGRVLEVLPLQGDRQLLMVIWDGEEQPSRVLGANLALVGPNSRICAC